MTGEYIQKLFNDNKEILFLPVEVHSGNKVYLTLFALWQEYIKFLKRTPEFSDCIAEAEFQIEQLKAFHFDGDLLSFRRYVQEVVQILSAVIA